MKDVLRAALAVPALKVADVGYNQNQIQKKIGEAAEKGATLVAFPELSLTGASCGDLFLSDLLCERAAEALCELRLCSLYEKDGVPTIRLGDRSLKANLADAKILKKILERG